MHYLDRVPLHLLALGGPSDTLETRDNKKPRAQKKETMAKDVSRCQSKEQPRLGIFWLHRRELIRFDQLAAEIPTEGGFKDYRGAHVEHWREVQKRYPELKAQEYETIPRGRVTYSGQEDVYSLLLPSAEAKNSKLVARLIAAFGLRKVRARVLADQHYDPPSKAPFD